MAKRTKAAVRCIAFFIIACGLIWWFLPVHFLREVEPEEVARMIVTNGNHCDEFAITNPDDISYVVNTMKQTTLKKDSFTSGADYYTLTFFNENREKTDSFGMQNPYIAREKTLFIAVTENRARLRNTWNI